MALELTNWVAWANDCSEHLFSHRTLKNCHFAGPLCQVPRKHLRVIYSAFFAERLTYSQALNTMGKIPAWGDSSLSKKPADPGLSFSFCRVGTVLLGREYGSSGQKRH